MRYKAKDTLAHWWWPGQWLRIVYSVWFDQVWYWRNVRPRLHGRAQGWEIFVQGMLGTAIVALAVVAVVGALVATAGIQIRWDFMAPTVALGMALGVLFGLLGVISGVATSLVAGMVVGMFMSVGMGVSVGLGVGVTQGAWWKIVFSNWSLVATAAILSVSIGVSQGVDNGRNWSIRQGLYSILVGGVIWGSSRGVAVGIAAALVSGFGFYLGVRWATRQIPDAETRQHLANPE